MTDMLSHIALGGATGLIFGTALEKSKVFLPLVIRNQMLFQSFTMLKMFLAASATGICTLSLYRWFTNKGPAVRQPTALGLNLMKGYGGNIVGGLILGAGMGIAGACPGTVFVQLGAGVPTAIYTLAGGAVGAALFTLFDSWATKRSSFGQRGRATSVNDLFGVSGTSFSIAASVAIISFVAFLEKTFPWAADLAPVLSSALPDPSPLFSYDLYAQAWSPISAGMLIGMLQVPSFVTTGALLGTSSSFVAVLANLVKITAPSLLDKLPYLKKFFIPADYWQLGIVSGMVGAGYLSSYLGNSTAILAGGISPASAFFGGVLLLLGARTAGGCTFLIVASIACLASSQSVNDTYAVQQVEGFTEYSGTVIKFSEEIATYGACVELCCDTSSCEGWMWVADDTNRNDTFICYLYSDITDISATTDVVYSGLQGSCSQNITSSLITGATTTLTPDETRSDYTEQECYDECLATTYYVSWSYEPDTSTCAFYILYPNLQDQVIKMHDHVLGIQTWNFPDKPSGKDSSDNNGIPEGVVIAISTIGTLLFCTVCSAACFIIIRKRVKRSKYLEVQ